MFGRKIGSGKEYPMPQYRAVRKSENKNLHQVFPIVVTKYVLPPEYFSTKYKGRTLLHATGVHYEFLPKLFDYLLNDCNPADFLDSATQFNEQYPWGNYLNFLSDKVVVYTNFMSGNCAARYDFTLKKKFGRRASGLYLAFYHEE